MTDGQLIDFTDDDLAAFSVPTSSPRSRRATVITQVDNTPTEQVAIVQVPRVSKPAAHLVSPAAASDWDWRQLRDYVVGQIEAIHGPQPRNPLKEKGIFDGFLQRWGAQGPQIAKAAFEVHRGFWHDAPISVNRFCKGSDEFFARPIADRL